jgi:aldehyde:ferredoxin oxidoreductase
MAQKPGYAGNILRVDLSSDNISTTPTEAYADKFVGGRGIAVKIHWDEVPVHSHPFDPENRLVMMTGPTCGLPGLAGSRWQVSGKSPIFNQFSYCNLGGAWGAQLKFAGYDGLVVMGKTDKLVYLVIDDGKVELKDASHLKGKGAIYTREKLKEELGQDFRVVAVGAAGENGVSFSTLLSDSDSSGSNGLGSVMGTKNLKAVAVRGSGKVEAADKEGLRELRKKIKSLKTPPGSWPTMLEQERLKKDMCFGCITGCMRANYNPKEGSPGKYICQSAVWYEIRAQRYYGEVNEVSFKANKMADDYGLDTRSIETMIMWLSRVHKAGIISEEETGLPLSKLGSLEFIETLLHKIAFREGFGDVLADGTIKAAERVGKNSANLIKDYMAKSGENNVYGPRLYLTTGLFYAMEPRMPIQQLHEISTLALTWAAREQGARENYMTSDLIRRIGKRFWGSEIAADFSTYEGKALAGAKIQDRQNAKECLILCDFSWPFYHTPATEDHLGDPTLESQICAAVTGRDIDEEGLYEVGARTFNVQRANMAREGHRGREFDTIRDFNFEVGLRGDYGNPECQVPGENGEAFSRKGMTVDRDEFEKMKGEFYGIRGWDVESGLQTRKSLEDLDLKDVADGLEEAGLLR